MPASPTSASSDTLVCDFCRSQANRHAKRCPHCASWLVKTDRGRAAQALEIVGAIWTILSIMGAVRLWKTVSAASPSGEPISAFQGFGYQLIIALLLQGLLVGLGAVVLASLVPPRPV